jgi:hypothetical protein
MMKHLRHTLMFLALFVVAISEVSAGVQQARTVRTDLAGRPSPAMYRLNLTLRMLGAANADGAADKVRQYTLILEDRSPGKIRALTKVPIVQGDQTTYVETGVKCDIQFQETETGQVRLEVEAIFSELKPVPERPQTPDIREWQSRVEATINPLETTILSNYENAAGDGRLQIEVHAEKLR